MPETASNSSVLPIARGKSGAISRAAVDILSSKVLEPHLGKPMSSDAKAELAELIGVVLDSNASPGRAAAGWGVAAFLAFAIVVGGMVITWDQISEIKEQQRSDTHYSQTLAHYLVIRAHNDGKNAENIDMMLRQIANAQGLDTSSIPAPVRTPPPAAVQRRDAEHRLEQGE